MKPEKLARYICSVVIIIVTVPCEITGRSALVRYLANATDNFFDPVPSKNPPLSVYNLKRTSLYNVKYYVHYAFAAYCYDNLVTWTCTNCRKLGPNVRYITDVSNEFTGAKAFFAIDHTRREIVVGFRGGSNLRNLAFVPQFAMLKVDRESDIRVHFGFYIGTISLYSKVLKELKKLTSAYPGYKVVMTGHSKGGAEATLTIFLIKLNNAFPRTSFELYNYGTPRLGNRAFATYFNSLDIPVARVVNHADLIPHTISPAAFGYFHHQNEVWVVNNAVKHCSTKNYEDAYCSNSQGPQFSAYDHLNYFDADYATCQLEDPVNYVLQAVVNLKPYVSKKILTKFRLDKLNLLPLNKALIRPVGLFFRNFLIV